MPHGLSDSLAARVGVLSYGEWTAGSNFANQSRLRAASALRERKHAGVRAVPE
jgi:hypothetical protein